MPATGDKRAAWLKLLFSTEPADRPLAEAGVRDLYVACGLPAPRYLLWFDSPFDAAWTCAMLLEGHHDDVWGHIMREESRSAVQRQKMAGVQADICSRIAEADWQGACSCIGRAFECLRPEDPLRQISELRCTLYSSLSAMQQATAFSDDDDLYRAENHFLGSPTGVIGTQESARPTGLLINSSVRSLYPFSLIAADEAQDRTPPPLLDALWRIARASGPWWPFEHAAILTERPAEIHINDRSLVHRGDGPAIVYRDGATCWAWDGQAVPEDWILHPERIAWGAVRECHPAFREHVEQHTSDLQRRKPTRRPRNLLSRYRAGEHEQVWADLVELGPEVREPRYASEALKVARETMRRVEANVRTVVGRLHMLEYRFKTKGMWMEEFARITESILEKPGAGDSPFAEKVQELATHWRQEARLIDYEVRAHVPPSPEIGRRLEELELRVGPLPLSLRTFYEIVGEVDLIGVHETISAEADPLVVFSIETLLEECGDEIAEDRRIPIAPDHYHKANISGGAPYEIAIPDPRADGELLNEPHNLFFVDYLRMVFRHGGFPGYAGKDRDVPKEIAILSEGLLSF